MSARVKELLKSDSICESYAQMKRIQFFDSQCSDWYTWTFAVPSVKIYLCCKKLIYVANSFTSVICVINCVCFCQFLFIFCDIYNHHSPLPCDYSLTLLFICSKIS